MGPLTSVSPCGTSVTTELFCHLRCHLIRLIQEVEGRAFLVTLNHRGKWLCDMCVFWQDWLYYFLRVERSAWCISMWISDRLWWWQWNPEWGFILFNWYFSLSLARLHLRSPGSGVVLDPRLLWLTVWPCYRHSPLPLLRNSPANLQLTLRVGQHTARDQNVSTPHGWVILWGQFSQDSRTLLSSRSLLGEELP